MILFVDMQANLGLRCPHMPDDTFSHGATQLKIRNMFPSFQENKI